jgi:hypothetical protein
MENRVLLQRAARIGTFLVLLTALLAVNAVRTTATRTKASPIGFEAQGPQLSNAATSIDELVDRFLRAVEAGDDHAVEALRVTEDEYRQIILPGSVEPGQPPQRFRDQESEYFWGVLNGKSLYSRANMMHGYGGKKFKLKHIGYQKGIREWAGYTAYEKLILTLEADDGQQVVLPTGSIAEVGGLYKFVSFIPAG